MLASVLSALLIAFGPEAAAQPQTQPAEPAPAEAPAAPQAPAAPAKPAEPDPLDRVVCTREHEMGSNRPKKVCMTVRERERLRDEAAAQRGAMERAGFQPRN